jgi:uncharacterized protein (DUF488 family)
MIIYTFGYGGHTLDTLRTHVRALHAVIVDVRYKPFSRARPEWSRTGLRDVFGPDYLWIEAFGNVNYAGGGPIKLFNPTSGLHTLRTHVLQQGRSPILLCVCGKVDHCHRLRVAEFLATETELPIVHLRQSAPRSVRRQADLFGG